MKDSPIPAVRKVLVLAFALIAAVVQAQTFSVLYDFGSDAADPLSTSSPGLIAQGRDGNLYSTSSSGGTFGLGTVFKITPDGTLTVLYSFDGTTGAKPNSGLKLGTDGNFYGAAYLGGTDNWGTVFKITSNGTLTVLHNFTDGSDGSVPNAPPVEGIDGNWYGTAAAGGTGWGTLYKVTPAGKFTTIHQFKQSDGFTPFAPLILGIDGNFYGTTDQGGPQGIGNVFRMSHSGSVKVLHNFIGTDGANPQAAVVQASDGNLYGTTVSGGANNQGAVFKITPKGKFTLLHSFSGTADGQLPYAGLAQATDGTLYGTTYRGGPVNAGILYKIGSTGNFSVLYNFDGNTAANPAVTLFQHTTGIPYGDTLAGGPTSAGTFYSFDLGLGPFVSLLPTTGTVGNTIGILGQGFTGATQVFFNGTSATFQFSSDTFLSATIPAGATTGPVTVSFASGNLGSSQIFRVVPSITSFTPTSGPVGTAVSITGISLTQTTKVTFGGSKAAQFTVNSDTQVTAIVPAGANKTGKIVITTPGGTAISHAVFTITP
jgi:uncharacterized repeat protein (TIGR03803 family)